MNTPPTRIVVVDDAPELRLLLRTRLRTSGLFQVVGEGADGSEAIALAREQHPELMLLDASMPGMDGLEALPRVREVSPDTKVVMFTGFEEQGLATTARNLGATAFVEKSVPVDTLVEQLAALAAGGPAPGPRVDDRMPEPAVREDQSVLDEHLERFREVFSEAAIGMATMTLTGHLVRGNRALADLVGRSVSDLVGIAYAALTDDHKDLVATALQNMQAQAMDVVQLEHGLQGRPGTRVRATLAPVRDSQGRPLYFFLQVQDITAENAALEELRKSEERFRLLVEVVEDYAIFMLDPTGHIVSWNSGAQRSQGYTAEEIIGQHFRVFYPPEVAARQHPEHELQLALRDGHYEEEGWRLRKDGSRFWANVLITAVFNDSGQHIGFAKVTRDNTERRRLEQERERAVEALAAANAELESLNQRLQQTAAGQSQFLAVTAHELRTPISVLGGSAQTLSRHWRDLTDQETGELFDAMTSSTARLQRLLADLLTASRLQNSALEMHRESVRLADIVADAMATVRRTHADPQIEVTGLGEARVWADRDRMAQAIDNLLSNGLRHGEPPVRVTAREGDGVVDLCVSDAGPGVSATIRPRLFERFATGRNKGGTGLGLFIVRELARAQGGEAFYEGEEEGGPVGGAFVLRLPVVRDDQGA
jgi:PAS domain S-box-containing protein